MSLVYFNLAVNRAVEKSHFYTEERRDIYLAQMKKIKREHPGRFLLQQVNANMFSCQD